MDYLLTFLFSLAGLFYHVMSKISQQKVRFPKLLPKEIWNNFFTEEWDTLITACGGVALYQLMLYIVRYNEVVLPDWGESIGIYAFAGLWGYASQRIAYKILNTSESALQRKIDKID